MEILDVYWKEKYAWEAFCLSSQHWLTLNFLPQIDISTLKGGYHSLAASDILLHSYFYFYDT